MDVYRRSMVLLWIVSTAAAIAELSGGKSRGERACAGVDGDNGENEKR